MVALLLRDNPSVDEVQSALALIDSIERTGEADVLRALLTQNRWLIDSISFDRVRMTVPIGLSSSSSLISPPNNFRCPVCFTFFNERSFDRHLRLWILSDKIGPVKRGRCGGIRDPNHPLLQKFPDGTLIERVGKLVDCIRDLLRPGAYDAYSATSSGRDIVIAVKIEELLAD